MNEDSNSDRAKTNDSPLIGPDSSRYPSNRHVRYVRVDHLVNDSPATLMDYLENSVESG